MRFSVRPVLLILVILFVLCGAASLSAQPTNSQDGLGAVIEEFGKMNSGQKDTIMASTGLPQVAGNFSVSNIVANLLFGSIGFIAFVYGKKQSSVRPTVIGILLMVYTYIFSNTFLIYAIGIALTASLYFFRE